MKYILAIVLGAATVAPALAMTPGYYAVSDNTGVIMSGAFYSMSACESSIQYLSGEHCEYRSQ